ncbi:hypothetical protein E2542_SST14431 [Spatholobus suberectus]|nr:hypothetical protein E2542_SST14431 [Spatholobus suberectus]
MRRAGLTWKKGKNGDSIETNRRCSGDSRRRDGQQRNMSRQRDVVMRIDDFGGFEPRTHGGRCVTSRWRRGVNEAKENDDITYVKASLQVTSSITRLLSNQSKSYRRTLFLSLMATTLTFFRPTMVRASAASPGKPDANNRKPVSSNWWTPLFGWPADPDYISSSGPSQKASEKSHPEPELGRSRSKFAAGGFTEEKAKELRKKTIETSTFHDIMYHSAIASRLASDVSKACTSNSDQ